MKQEDIEKLKGYVAKREAIVREMDTSIEQLMRAINDFGRSDRDDPCYGLRVAGNEINHRNLSTATIGRLMVLQGLRELYGLFPEIKPEDSVVES